MLRRLLPTVLGIALAASVTVQAGSADRELVDAILMRVNDRIVTMTDFSDRLNVELSQMGYTPAQAGQIIQRDAMIMINNARASGRSAPEWIHTMAKARGFDAGHAIDRMTDDEADAYWQLKEAQAKRDGYRPGLKNGR